MPKFKVVLQRFPYGSVEHTPVVNWLLGFVSEVSADRRFELIIPNPLDDTPITMTRNRSVEIARQLEADFLVMVDSDMDPDCELKDDPLAKPFWKTTIEFMLKHHGPCVVGAPYCGPPPHENIYVFQWTNKETGVPADDVRGIRLDQFSREHAAILGGIQEVAALPTGLIVFDMRGFDKIKPPYFNYEYEGDGPRCDSCHHPVPGKQTHKASTEDVVTTRDLSLGGVPQFCNWDAWAGHRKTKTVRKPRLFTADGIAEKMHHAILTRNVSGKQLLEIDGSRFAAEIAAAEAQGVVPHDFKVHGPGNVAKVDPLSVELDRISNQKVAGDPNTEIAASIEESGLAANDYANLFNGPLPNGTIEFGDPAFSLPPVTFGDLLLPMDGLVPPGALDPNSLPMRLKGLTPPS